MTPPREYRIKDVLVCAATRRVRAADGEALHLRPKTLSTLLYLLENRGRVISKEELIHGVWNGTAVTDDVLVGCIREIRAAFDDDPHAPEVIRTVLGTGYEFIGPVVESVPRTRRVPGMRTRSVLAGAALLVALLAWGLARFWPEAIREVGWWRFDEAGGNRIEDSSGLGNAGTIAGSAERQPGVLGKAIYFGGRGSVIGESSGSGFPKGSAPFTLSAWLRCENARNQTSALFHLGKWNAPGRSSMHLLLLATGRIGFGWATDYPILTGETALTDGEWHHVAAAYAANLDLLELYVDGRRDCKVPMPWKGDLRSGAPWTIGVLQTGGPAFPGYLDDVRLYNGVLTAPQVAALYSCSRPHGDVMLPGGTQGYYLPLYRSTLASGTREGAASSSFGYEGFGCGGAEFATCDGTCALASLRGASLPRDIHVSAEIRLPSGTQGGPFVRAHRVRPGDPIEGRGFGGIWVRLHDDGHVTVHRLDRDEKKPAPPIAASDPADREGRAAWHTIEVEAIGRNLKVRLDGAPVRFRRGAALVDVLSMDGIPAEDAAGIGVVAPPVPTDAVLVRNVRIAAAGA